MHVVGNEGEWGQVDGGNEVGRGTVRAGKGERMGSEAHRLGGKAHRLMVLFIKWGGKII